MTRALRVTLPRMSAAIVWHFSDGKAGHVNQVHGLIAALAKLTPVETHVIEVGTSFQARFGALWRWLRGSFPQGKNLPPPTLLIGAGSSTHLPLLAAKRAHGGRAIVLMKPNYPLSWYDLCIIPEHDGVGSVAANVIETRGVLNPIERSATQRNDRGLILLGGPSKHHGWDDERIAEQVTAIVQHDSQVRWTLTTSRRTPASVLPRLQTLGAANLTITPVDQTDKGWVPAQLRDCAQIWASEDSVSMVYESLTSGAAVGLLDVPRKGTARGEAARVLVGVQKLIAEGWVTPFVAWRKSGVLTRNGTVLDEATRCAAIVRQRLLA